jgi:hypothetical protein
MGFKNSIQKFTNLPSVCESGFTLEISGDDDDQFNNWYVKYVNESSLSTGIWKETVKPGLDNAFNPLTMPHRLVRTGENVFTFAPIIWSERKVGDTDSAPEPSFIELPIQSVFFHKNRLGFLSKDNVILSTAGDYFNFWPSTALDILDDDPIDVAANSDKAITLRNAISLPNGLLMTSDEQHFVLSSGDDLLTPKTASIEPASTIDTESLSQPVAAGSTFFFVSPKGSYSGIREYYAQSEVIATDSADITAHVPKYIPKNITSLAVNPNYDILLALSSNELNNLYVYKYQWQGEEKVQSAWSLWSFDDDIIDIKSIGSYIYLLTKKDNQVALLRLNLDIVDSSSLDFKVHLDKQTTVTGVYNIATNKTTWTLPYNDTSDIFEVINLSNGLAINTTKISNNQLQATGDYSTIECLVGKNYTKRYRLSEWYYRTQESNVANLDANIQLRKMIVSYEDSGYFRVEVTPYRRTLVSFKDLINSRIIGSSKIGQPSITSGEASVMVLGPSIGTSIDIINDTYLPSKITSITLEGLLIQHSNPI